MAISVTIVSTDKKGGHSMADETETVALSVPQDITAEQAVLGSILLSGSPRFNC